MWAFVGFYLRLMSSSYEGGGYRYRNDVRLPWRDMYSKGRAVWATSTKSHQPFILPGLQQILCLGELKTCSWYSTVWLPFIYSLIVKWAKPPLHPLFLGDQSSISLWLIPSNGDHSSLFTQRRDYRPEQMRWSAQQCWDMALQSTADREGEDDIVPECRNVSKVCHGFMLEHTPGFI